MAKPHSGHRAATRRSGFCAAIHRPAKPLIGHRAHPGPHRRVGGVGVVSGIFSGMFRTNKTPAPDRASSHSPLVSRRSQRMLPDEQNEPATCTPARATLSVEVDHVEVDRHARRRPPLCTCWCDHVLAKAYCSTRERQRLYEAPLKVRLGRLALPSGLGARLAVVENPITNRHHLFARFNSQSAWHGPGPHQQARFLPRR